MLRTLNPDEASGALFLQPLQIDEVSALKKLCPLLNLLNQLPFPVMSQNSNRHSKSLIMGKFCWEQTG
jgi:hypothetical protein